MGCGKLVPPMAAWPCRHSSKDDRNSQAAVLDEKSLDRVGQFRHAARVLALARVAGPAYLANSVPVPKGRLRLLEIEVAAGVYECLALFLPDAQHLRGLFLQRRPPQKVRHSSRCWQARVPVRRCSIPLGNGFHA